jgi:hypothetical protein
MLPVAPDQGPSVGMTFDPRQPVNLAPFFIAAAAILVISFLARVIQPAAPASGIYELKPARAPTRSPRRRLGIAAQLWMAAMAALRWRPRRLGTMASKYARIVFGILS